MDKIDKEIISIIWDYIERDWNKLIIKWKEKTLNSFADWDISFWKKVSNWTDKVTVIKTTFNELKEWDVFICEEAIDNMALIDFEVIIWIDDDWYLQTQFIRNDWCDYIDNTFRCICNRVVYKINRF